MLKNISTAGIAAALFLCGCATEKFGGVNSADYVKNSGFESGKVLLDENGRAVNAHGAGFIFDGGRYYMFGEHKLGGTLGNKALAGVHCYSSADLYNWRDEGLALEMSKDPESPIIVGTVLERPKVVFNKKTGKYVMFAHLEERKGATAKSPKLEDILKERPNYRAAKIAIAVSDKVEGPYKFLRALRPNAGKYPVGWEGKLKAVRTLLDSKHPNWDAPDKALSLSSQIMDGHIFLRDFPNGQMSRDMTVFVDDDAKAYLITASEENATLHIHELTDDYLDFTGKFTRALVGGLNEAPAVFKKDGKYFMFTSYCTGWAPNPGRLSVADSMLGEWKQVGNPCRGAGQPADRTYPEAKADTTFRSQSTYVIPVEGKKDAFIYVGDRWLPNDAIDGRYIFLPVEWENGLPVIRWHASWDLSFFDKAR